MIRLSFFTFLSLINMSFCALAQNTNIQHIPSPKIDESNLKTLVLNTNEELKLIDFTDAENSIYYDSKSAPAVIQLSSHEYVYNYYAVHHSKLCPSGKHVITYDETKGLLNIDMSNFKISSENFQWLDIEASCDSTTPTKIDFNRDPIIGVYNPNENQPDDNKFEAVIFRTDQINSRRLEVSDFLPTRCVEDTFFSFQKNTYSYSELMPIGFTMLKKEIGKAVLFKTNNGKYKFNYNPENLILGFDHLGINNSIILPNLGGFWNDFVQSTVVSSVHYPKLYFESLNISTKDTITISLERHLVEKKAHKTGSCDFDFLFYSKENVRNFKIAHAEFEAKKTFYSTQVKIEFKEFKYKVLINNTPQDLPTKYVSNFILPSALAPLKSLIIPGLGSKALNFTKSGKIHTSIAASLFVCGFVSFVTSQLKYQKYLNNYNSEGANSFYKSANCFHKVGLIVLGAYYVCSISDIITCYAKCKNKGFILFGNKGRQQQLNKEIEDNCRNNIYLCKY